MMEEPTPCPGCGDIVEFAAMRRCRRCDELFCPVCLDALRECAACVERIDTRPKREAKR